MQIGVRAWSSLPEQNREEVTSIRLLRSFPSRNKACAASRRSAPLRAMGGCQRGIA